MKWYQLHSTGISAFVCGLCFLAMLDYMIRGNWWSALLELFLFALNAIMYKLVFDEQNKNV